MKNYNYFFRYFLCIALIVVLSKDQFSQVETINSNHPVYDFLQQMYVKGVLKNYSNVLLPKSRNEILSYLLEIKSNQDNLSTVEKNFLSNMIEKIKYKHENDLNILHNFPNHFFNNVTKYYQKHLYYYDDSLLTFTIDPVLEAKYISSTEYNSHSTLINFGGYAKGSYNNWFGFLLKGTNGIVTGNRNVARIDQRVEQSYTFNKTGINFFDETEGYARFHSKILNFELGRERILFGNGYINKLYLSNNPQTFDFIKLDLKYKRVSYNFIHGWLVQKPQITYIDSLIGNVKNKNSKYIAISRLGYSPLDKINLGISQIIVYSGRPFEAAYINPFLFWESAQRSMNDLDNSYLALDASYLISNGISSSCSIMFDDIDFKRLFSGEWNSSKNSLTFQINFMLTSPILPDNMTLETEYTQVRPFMFSHPGIGESLTYTNNGYLLGIDLQPNSILYGIKVNYMFNESLNFSVSYKLQLHGENIYDSQGNLIKNVGSNVFENLTQYSSEFVRILDGKIIKKNTLDLNLNYELLYGFYLYLNYSYHFNKLSEINNSLSIFQFDFYLNFD